ncbi:SDR family oxidoreductase [Ruania rhizosphaerae]|uniref:SDR family oxidoreductase n=1 Tax=Ruania rhizosphaerae TaxID=1840413 RepID=UPI00135BEFDB|nr:SDR family oxidoreductase [Ruania rhizosphaerae]
MHDPRTAYHSGEFPGQRQDSPGSHEAMNPVPDSGAETYVGHGRLAGRRTLITGADSGIGRAVAIAFAREGSTLAINYLPEESDDAARTVHLIGSAGPPVVQLPADLRDESANTEVVAQSLDALGGLDVLVLNAGYQHDVDDITALETSEMRRVVETNFMAPLITIRAAAEHLSPGSCIIITTSIQASDPSPGLVDYAMTKAAQVALVKALAQSLGERGIRVNGVAPGPIWTPLIPSTGWSEDHVASFGQDTPLGRAGQPAELAGAYVYLASDDASYTSGCILAVTGGKSL